jgi:hypothetical protein
MLVFREKETTSVPVTILDVIMQRKSLECGKNEQINQLMLKLRNVLPVIPLRAESSDRSEMVSQILYGEQVIQKDETDKWLKVQCTWDGYEGWIAKEHLLKTDEIVNHIIKQPGILKCADGSSKFLSQGSRLSDDELAEFIPIIADERTATGSMIKQLALSYLNTPYLWGGRSCWGIDCSGFVQVVFAMLGHAFPRDAYQQAALGTLVEIPELREGDIAYFHNDKSRITHVGIMLSSDRIIHASGMVRIDKLTSEGIIREADSELTHRLNCIKRVNI